jgi:GntR family transcriptional repressor for pyruvate dehydrogenase complex
MGEAMGARPGRALRAVQGASEHVALQIRHHIQRERLEPGDFLGREDDLAAEFGVSRATLREALKLLGSGNLIRASKGPGGGIFVANTAEQGMSRSVSDSIAAMLETGTVSLEELLDARLLLEVPLAGLAAVHAGEDAIRQLKEAVASAADDGTIEEEDARIHQIIASSAGNRLVEALTGWVREVAQPRARRGRKRSGRSLRDRRAAPDPGRRDRERGQRPCRTSDEGPSSLSARRVADRPGAVDKRTIREDVIGVLDERRRGKAKSFVLLWLTGLSLRITLLSVPPLLLRIRANLGLSNVEVAALTTLPLLLFSAAATLGSGIVSFVGARRTLIAGLILAAAASALRGATASVAALFIFTFVMGLGIAAVQPAVPALVQSWVSNAIGRATATYVNGLLVAEAAAASLTPVLLPALGSWEAALAV